MINTEAKGIPRLPSSDDSGVEYHNYSNAQKYRKSVLLFLVFLPITKLYKICTLLLYRAHWRQSFKKIKTWVSSKKSLAQSFALQTCFNKAFAITVARSYKQRPEYWLFFSLPQRFPKKWCQRQNISSFYKHFLKWNWQLIPMRSSVTSPIQVKFYKNTWMPQRTLSHQRNE